MTTLGQKIRELRKAKLWTEGELAYHAGLKRPYVSLVELGQIKRPSAEKLLALAKALGVQPELLYTAAGYETPTKVYDLPAARFQHLIKKARKLSSESQDYLAEMLGRMIEHETAIADYQQSGVAEAAARSNRKLRHVPPTADEHAQLVDLAHEAQEEEQG